MAHRSLLTILSLQYSQNCPFIKGIFHHHQARIFQQPPTHVRALLEAQERPKFGSMGPSPEFFHAMPFEYGAHLANRVRVTDKVSVADDA